MFRYTRLSESRIVTLMVLGCGYIVAACNLARAESSTCPEILAWQAETPLTDARSEMACESVGGLVYAFGDYNYSPINHTATVYDPQSEVWTALAPMPLGRGQAAAAAIGDSIYVVGGNTCFSNCWRREIESYDVNTGTWDSNHPDMPGEKRGWLSVASVDGKLYVMGGTNSYDPPTYSDNFVFDPVANSWASAAPLPAPRSHHCSAVVDGRIYVIGGQYRFSHNQEVYPTEVDIYDPATDTWSSAQPLPAPRTQLSCDVMGGRIFVTGGVVDGQPVDTVEIYDPATDSWSCGISLPEVRANHCTTAVGGEVYVIGGVQPGGNRVDSVFSGAPEVEGACCVRGQCGAMRGSQCAAIGGFFNGDGSTCLESTCAATCAEVADVFPCEGGDGQVDIFDILTVLNGFAGIDCCATGP